MRSTLRLLPLLALTAALAFKIGATRKTATAQAAPPELNACGCYRDSAGTCYCGKKTAKCVCPGECEPKGCDEKRAKELNKEIEAEAKRARDADKKQQEEQAERKRKEEAPLPDDQGNPSPDCGSATLAMHGATMFPSTDFAAVDKRILSSDELNAACEIYPYTFRLEGAGCAIAPAGHTPIPSVQGENQEGVAWSESSWLFVAAAAFVLGWRRRASRSS